LDGAIGSQSQQPETGDEDCQDGDQVGDEPVDAIAFFVEIVVAVLEADVLVDQEDGGQAEDVECGESFVSPAAAISRIDRRFAGIAIDLTLCHFAKITCSTSFGTFLPL
jgi:hypothetical protein